MLDEIHRKAVASEKPVPLEAIAGWSMLVPFEARVCG